MKRELQELCMAMAILTSATIMALSPDAYLPMLARAFIVPTVLLCLVAAMVAAWRRKWWVLQSALLACGMLAVQVRIPVAGTDGARTQGLRVLHMNVLQPNTAFNAVIERAMESEADLISFQEVGPEWACALREGLAERYPYTHVEERTNCYGIALFSKRPFNRVRTIVIRSAPFIEAIVNVQDEPVRVLTVHATSPISYGHFKRRNEQLRTLAAYLGRTDTTTIVVGDLNTVPWDGSFIRFCARAGLHSTTPSMQRTWPSWGPLALIPLDHVLVSPDVRPAALRTVNIPGSDHRGVLADLNILGNAR